MPRKAARELVDEARTILERQWQEVCEQASQGELKNALDDPALLSAIHRSVRSKTKTYRYVLPTQLVAKLADPTLDRRSLQVRGESEGAFDARSVAHKVIVPFDRENDRVLGGAPEPYVNNPLRVPEVSLRHQGSQKDKEGWADLCAVLAMAEQETDPLFTKQLFKQTLVEIYHLRAEVKITYPAPLRISLGGMIQLIREFVAGQSGGDRVEAVASALFLIIGRRLGLYQEVRRGVINAADASTGLAADLECVGREGEVVLAVEVKDKELTVAEIENKLRNAREKKIAEMLFIAQKGMASGDQATLQSFVEDEFARGQNVYIFGLEPLASSVLSIMGEDARPEFLRLVGQQLDQYRSDLRHRQAWRDLLTRI